MGMAGLTGILLSGCAPGITSGKKPNHRNLVFISIDTLRADHLGCYGYRRNTSPNIDAFAKNNIVFENFFTVVPKTSPSMTSFFTGRYIQHHGVLSNRLKLQGSIVSLAELLPEAHKKAAFVCQHGLSRVLGYRGFDLGSHILTSQGAITGQAIEYLKGIKDAENFFLWLHYIDPHGPYTPPPEFHEMFVHDSFYDGSRKVSLNYTPSPGYNANYVLDGQVAVPRYIRQGDIDEVDYYIAQYDAEIRYTDSEVGKVLDYVKTREFAHDTIIAISADHGESLGENDYYFGHGKLVNEGNIRIPLIISHPEVGEPLRIRSLLQNTDFAPTMLAEFGLEFPGEIDGIDFSALYKKKDAAGKLRDYIYSCTPHEYPHFFETIRTENQKFIHGFATEKVGELLLEMERKDDKDIYSFHDVSNHTLDDDGGVPLSEVPQETIEKYVGLLKNFGLGAQKPTRETAVDDSQLPQDIKENLKALGYINS